MTLGDVLRRAAGHLERTSETSRLDAELLLAHALGRSRIELYTDFDRPLNAAELDAYRTLVARRARREPVAYILGEWGFRRLTLTVDRRALKQVLINLLANAVKFTPDRGRVNITARRDRDHATIVIADTGIGIPQTELGKLGRAFEQVENQFTKTKSGSGLGLAISKSLVEMHGGSLVIASEIGKGTTVTISLPMQPVSEAQEIRRAG